MAASSSQSSPSNHKKVVSDTTATADTTKAAPAGPSDTAVINPPSAKTPPEPPVPAEEVKIPTKTAAVEPSYEDSEKSDHYVLAKTLLKEGDFEQALTFIEEGLSLARAIVVSVSGKKDDDDPYVNLHESLAPFHYLYGTTLLYSIEESSDSQAMTTTAAATAANGGENPEGDEGEEVADDMQIAWENLEAARTIIEQMVACNPSSDKLKLDLAQIFLREGDLQRLNGRYEMAVQDYQSCLHLRQDNSLLGPYDRKVADVHYNLGLNYMMLVAEVKNSASSDQDQSTTEEQPVMDPVKNEKMRAEYRSKSFQHYFACAKSFCGQIAFLCNEDPAELLAKAEKNITRFKSTGEEDSSSLENPQVVGLKLKNLRELITSLHAPEEHQELVSDLCQLLEEIQETIDEAENSEEGVKQVSDMKAEISAAAAGEDAAFAGTTSADGATTSVGFGSATASAGATVATGAAGFGPATIGEPASATAQPVMMVKKKKKRPPTEDDSKMPAQDDPSKRSKTE